MTWENTVIKSVEEVKDFRTDAKEAMAVMADRMKQIKKKIRASDLYETWADNLDDGLYEAELALFDILYHMSKYTGAATLKWKVAHIYMNNIDQCRTLKESLKKIETECKVCVQEESQDMEDMFCSREANILKELLNGKTLFGIFNETVCWIADEISDRASCLDMSDEQICDAIRKHIITYVRYVDTRWSSEDTHSVVSTLERNIVTGLVSLKLFFMKQREWGRMKQQKVY